MLTTIYTFEVVLNLKNAGKYSLTYKRLIRIQLVHIVIHKIEIGNSNII